LTITNKAIQLIPEQHVGLAAGAFDALRMTLRFKGVAPLSQNKGIEWAGDFCSENIISVLDSCTPEQKIILGEKIIEVGNFLKREGENDQCLVFPPLTEYPSLEKPEVEKLL